MYSLKKIMLYEALNKGDFSEAILAYALYLFIINRGNIPVEQLASLRSMYKLDDTKSNSIFTDKANIQLGHASIGASVFIRIKTKRVIGGFGNSLIKNNEVDNIITTISQHLGKLPEMQKLANLLHIIAEVPKSAMTFEIVADGVAGESSGGNIKADVTIQISTDEKSALNKEIRDLSQELKVISISIKYKSKTVANLSPIKGSMDLANKLGFAGNDSMAVSTTAATLVELRKKLARSKAAGAPSKELKKIRQQVKDATSGLAIAFLSGVERQAVKERDDDSFANFINSLFRVVEHNIVGSDGSVLYNIEKNDIKRISRKQIQDLAKLLSTSNQVGIGIEGTEGYTDRRLQFYIYNLDNPELYDYLFKFRYKIAESRSDSSKPPEIKFYIETQGQGLYKDIESLKKHLQVSDENIETNNEV